MSRSVNMVPINGFIYRAGKCQKRFASALVLGPEHRSVLHFQPLPVLERVERLVSAAHQLEGSPEPKGDEHALRLAALTPEGDRQRERQLGFTAGGYLDVSG